MDTGSDSEAKDDDASAQGDVSAIETDGQGAAAGMGKKTPNKRRRRQNLADKYDVEDPFIDDSEALMEQVAAASKNGFFVYSGPLIAEGERAKIDKYGSLSRELLSPALLSSSSVSRSQVSCAWLTYPGRNNQRNENNPLRNNQATKWKKSRDKRKSKIKIRIRIRAAARLLSRTFHRPSLRSRLGLSVVWVGARYA